MTSFFTKPGDDYSVTAESLGIDARGLSVRVEGTDSGIVITVGDEKGARQSTWNAPEIEFPELKAQIEKITAAIERDRQSRGTP